MLQDILPHRLDLSYHPSSIGTESRALVFEGEKLLAAAQGGALGLPRVSDCSFSGSSVWLFRLDQTDFFLLDPPVRADGYTMLPVSELRRCPVTKELSFAAMTGYQLYKWYRDNRFCGRCGAALAPACNERALRCDCCGNVIYPKISPVVIVGVTDGDRLLMTRYAKGEYRNWALVAGFVEVGETPEDAVHREVLEETGIRIKNPRYVAAQPWAFSDSLLLGFFAELDGSDKIALQESELSQAAWIPRAEIRHRPEDFSLTGDLIDRFVRGEMPN